MKNKITVSVVVCTYNGAKKIRACLESLLRQTYPKDKYEIIVVYDWSTDDTYDIASRYPVKVIRHEKNKGLSAARNAGLKIAQGKIYACFDDDCIAEPNWLINLIDTYKKNKDIAGIPGISILPSNPTFIDIFIINYVMTPAPIAHGISKHPLFRFITYIKNALSPYRASLSELYEVFEIFGFSASFPTSILRNVNGWNEVFSGCEDIELCSRIKNVYPNRVFYITPNAKIIHDHKLNLYGCLKKPYKRGYVNLIYYQQMHKVPQFLPFPFFFFFSCLFTITMNVLLGVTTILVLPHLLYFWWSIRFLKEFKFYYLLFPYIQLSYETMVIAGLIRGYILLTN